MAIAELPPLSFPTWRFILVNNKDMSRIEELKGASEGNIEIVLDQPGQVSFNFPMNDPTADAIEPYKTGILAERFNYRDTLIRHLSGEGGAVWDKMWSGYVLPVKQDWTNDKLQVSAIGWINRLTKRLSRDKLIFTGQDDGDIILSILQHANNLTGTTAEKGVGVSTATMADTFVIHWPAGSSPNTSTFMKYGGKLPNEGVGGATAYVASAGRNITVEKYTSLYQPIQDLINLENGCDVVVDPVTRALNIHRKYSRDNDDIVLGFRAGIVNNVSEFDVQIDADQKANYFLVQGAPSATPQYAADATDMDEVGPIEEVISIGNVTDTAVLLAYAGAELLVRKDGVVTYGITPMQYIPNSGIPEPFIDYRVGDYVSVRAHHPTFTNIVTPAGIRIFGMKVSLDSNKNEKLSQLQVAP